MLETSLFVAGIAALGMLSPGPDFFLVIKNAARYPRLAAMMTAFGVICGVATHMSYCVAGLAVVMTWALVASAIILLGAHVVAVANGGDVVRGGPQRPGIDLGQDLALGEVERRHHDGRPRRGRGGVAGAGPACRLAVVTAAGGSQESDGDEGDGYAAGSLRRAGSIEIRRRSSRPSSRSPRRRPCSWELPARS